MSYNISRLFLCSVGLLLFIASCQQIDKVFQKESPRQKYVKAIQESPLAKNEVIQEWISAGSSVLADPVPVSLPLQAKLVFFIDEPNARAWQFELPQGRTFRAHLAIPGRSTPIFMDIFTLQNGEHHLKQSAEDSLITFTADQSQTFILRIQPEVLTQGSATLTITDQPSMAFPVEDGIGPDIGSFWGDPRDGGSRRHEGVDIFAERGTPVLAVADGRVRRTGNGGLGGKTVWLRAGGLSIYYAHLDSIDTHMGQKADIGDTLGFVGNTGNARTTPPHLHFGIYDGGAVNPLPFIDFVNTQIEPITADPLTFPKWGRVNAAKANVRPLPSTEEAPILTLSHNNPVKIIGAAGGWYRVELPNRKRGFIYQSLLESADTRLRTKQLSTGDTLLSGFTQNNFLLQSDSTQTLNIYGTFSNKLLAKYQEHWVWVGKSEE